MESPRTKRRYSRRTRYSRSGRKEINLQESGVLIMNSIGLLRILFLVFFATIFVCAFIVIIIYRSYLRDLLMGAFIKKSACLFSTVRTFIVDTAYPSPLPYPQGSLSSLQALCHSVSEFYFQFPFFMFIEIYRRFHVIVCQGHNSQKYFVTP
jgi:hypothetical protein